ncbi:hypothetical protein RGC52_06760 [Helicobacter pylori]|uniref:hypothetical protein n=1 Tax=Helicobacter pylori TaxID=210 RepID=UPI0029280AA2|nr:hypothetical protein [Helicobacter pylori]MDU9711414.1 hypothetical protein [Helicobacter pylori]
MKPRDIEIIQSVLEAIKEPIKVTLVYDKAKELFEKGEITKMFDCGGETPHQSVSSYIYTALNKGEELPFKKVREKPTLIVFSKKFDTLPIKLVSFELKKEISVNNGRECYFQAISNSSWANEGYLVGRHIETHNPQLMDLLKRLHASFGIGVIDLRTDEDKSAILLNAKYKEKIDYTVASELSAKNEKFSGFLKSVVDYDPAHSYRYKDEFDEIKKKEELYPNSSLSF